MKIQVYPRGPRCRDRGTPYSAIHFQMLSLHCYGMSAASCEMNGEFRLGVSYVAKEKAKKSPHYYNPRVDVRDFGVCMTWIASDGIV